MRRVLLVAGVVCLSSCSPPVVELPDAGAGGAVDAGRSDGGSDAGAGADDAGSGDGGAGDAGARDAGFDAGLVDAGTTGGGAWRFVPIVGSQCALGAQAGFGYQPGRGTELVIYLQGGGACWNTGTCQPSLQQWGPVCNYGSNSLCLWDQPGGTQPLAVFVSHPDPFPADGGGAFPSELRAVSSSLLFTRRAENPLQHATYVFVPYCTGDLHAGDATRTYFVKADAFSQPVARVHHFAGARNLDLYLADLRARHPRVDTLWLTGVSGGGYGASLNLHRVRAVFPEAQVHLLADSAPMLDSPHYDAWKTEWNLQYPPGCAGACDAGLPGVMARQLDLAPSSSRVALLAFEEDQVITRFFFSSGDTGSWLTPPFASYRAALTPLLAEYDARANAEYFVAGGQEHVMLQGYGVVQSDGGITPPRRSDDGGVSLKEWIDAWATGAAGFLSVR